MAARIENDILKSGHFRAAFRFFLLLSALAAVFVSPLRAAAQTELGSEDDLTVLGTDGTVPDPDVELKGFVITGSTNVLTHISTAPGNVVINGALEVSSDVYVVGKSTFANNVYIIGFASATKYYGDASSMTGLPAGDNLGNHIAVTTLNMNSWNLVNVSSVNFRDGVYLSSATAAQQGGVYVSSNLFVAGLSSATAYYGDGSRLTGVSTDTLKLGDSYGGGIVFWVDAKGRNALISAPADMSAGIGWAPTDGFTGAQADGVGAGKANTVMISTMAGAGSYAARLCADYAVTVDGVYYDDWYLPSLAELQRLYAQRSVVGGFSISWYWSSTEYGTSPTNSWAVRFLTGGVTYYAKSFLYAVRCVRGGPVSAFDHLRDAETVRNGAYVGATQTFTGYNTFTNGVKFNPLAANVAISSEASSEAGGGVRVSTNIYIVGFASATSVYAGNFYGNGSNLTGVAGDNLGNHTATQQLKMGSYAIYSSSDITAAHYQINGNTVLAVLPGSGSLGVGVDAGRASNISGYSNTFLGYQVGYNNTSGYRNTAVGESALRSNTTMGDNTANGFRALYFNSNGGYNTANGSQALYNNTDGANNTATGAFALVSNIAGSGNTADGYQALVYNQTGSQNTVSGYNAGGLGAGAVNSFSSATIMGAGAGYNLTTGGGNTFLGWQSGYTATTGARNIVIGYDQRTSAAVASNELNIGGVLYGDLSAKTIGISTRAPQAALDIVSTGTTAGEMAQIWRGSDGVVKGSMSATGVMMAAKFIGDGSGLAGLPGDNLGNHTATQQLKMGGYAVWSSSDISASAYQIRGSTVLAIAGSGTLSVGPDAGRVNGPTGNANVFVGAGAGYSNTTGDENIFLGSQAGYFNAGGVDNIFLGPQAGYFNEYGGSNIAIGWQAGYKNVSGSYNVFVGEHAGWGNISGADNTFFGNYAGEDNVGDSNAFFGSASGQSNTTGKNNLIMGHHAGRYTMSGAANTMLGADAGYGVLNNSFSSSTLVGYNAGQGLSTGSDNIFVGWQSGYTTTTGARNIVIGYDQRTSAAAAGNELNIGGVLYGDLAAKTIGISTRAPQAALDVVSTGTAANQMAQLWRASDGVVKGSMSATGVMMAAKFIGDGSGLAGLPGDNLGNHTAVQNLNMAGFPAVNLSSVSMTGDGLHIATSVYAGASGLVISTGGAIATTGAGYGSVAGNARGQGAVDFQTVRTAADQVAAPRYSSILGGTSNKIAETGPGWGAESVIAGGWSNAMSDGYRSFIGAGQQNNIMPPGANFAVIGGGYQNKIDQSSGAAPWAAVVVGGGTNVASNYASFVGGGQSNIARGYVSAIPGGEGNLAGGSYSGIFGGGYNTVTGGYSASAGGEGNVIRSSHSFVAGSNIFLGAQADHSIAFGYQAYAFPEQYITASNAFLIDPYHNGYKVGIGTPTPVALLHLSSGATTGNMLVISTGSSDVIRMTGAGEIFAGKFYGTIPKSPVQAADTGITATAADFGKTITVNSAAAQTVTLPAVTAADIGATITIVKLGTGRVTVQAAASTYIADSSAAGTLYNSAVSPPYASVTLVLVAADRWLLVGGYGAWITT